MRKDKAEVYAGAHGTVQSVGVDGKHPIGFEGEAQCLAYGILHTYIGVNGKEGLLVQYGHAFGLPVVLVAGEHIKRCLHTATEGSADVRSKLAMLPEPVGQQACPEEFVVAATLGTLLDRSGGEITLEACTEVVGEVQFGTSADAEGRTADVEPKGIVATVLVAAMHHHTA